MESGERCKRLRDADARLLSGALHVSSPARAFQQLLRAAQTEFWSALGEPTSRAVLGSGVLETHADVTESGLGMLSVEVRWREQRCASTVHTETPDARCAHCSCGLRSVATEADDRAKEAAIALLQLTAVARLTKVRVRRRSCSANIGPLSLLQLQPSSESSSAPRSDNVFVVDDAVAALSEEPQVKIAVEGLFASLPPRLRLFTQERARRTQLLAIQRATSAFAAANPRNTVVLRHNGVVLKRFEGVAQAAAGVASPRTATEECLHLCAWCRSAAELRCRQLAMVEGGSSAAAEKGSRPSAAVPVTCVDESNVETSARGDFVPLVVVSVWKPSPLFSSGNNGDAYTVAGKMPATLSSVTSESTTCAVGATGLSLHWPAVSAAVERTVQTLDMLTSAGTDSVPRLLFCLVLLGSPVATGVEQDTPSATAEVGSQGDFWLSRVVRDIDDGCSGAVGRRCASDGTAVVEEALESAVVAGVGRLLAAARSRAARSTSDGSRPTTCGGDAVVCAPATQPRQSDAGSRTDVDNERPGRPFPVARSDTNGESSQAATVFLSPPSFSPHLCQDTQAGVQPLTQPSFNSLAFVPRHVSSPCKSEKVALTPGVDASLPMPEPQSTCQAAVSRDATRRSPKHPQRVVVVATRVVGVFGGAEIVVNTAATREPSSSSSSMPTVTHFELSLRQRGITVPAVSIPANPPAFDGDDHSVPPQKRLRHLDDA